MLQMAVFLVNNCTFQGCGLTFTSLADLIQHIEETHIGTQCFLLYFTKIDIALLHTIKN